MGYGVAAYSLDTKKFLENLKKDKSFSSIIKNKLFGNQSYKERLIKECSCAFGRVNSLLDDYEVDVRAEELFKIMIHEQANGQELGSAFGYLFEEICRVEGDFLDNDEWYPTGTESFYCIPFTTYHFPLTFPSPNGFPGILRVKYEDIDLEHADFKDLPTEQIQQATSWFIEAIQHKKDLYLFLY